MSDASLAKEAVSKPLASGHEPLASSRPSVESKWSLRAAAAWQTIEGQLSQASEWFNPILVKETRQALRSWQFTLSFLMLLVACWVVTIGGVAMIGPSIYYAAGGSELLRGYYFILSLPLLVVVPFAAFRSLAAEREDNTYDLVSITLLGPRQIISGKLASAVVQMVMFYSAITPCLAFTYLLRGVDAPTIALLLLYTFLTSLALSLLGLLLATLPRRHYGQLLLSVAFVGLTLYVCYQAQRVAAQLVRSGFELYNDPDFWIANVFGAAIYLTTMVVIYLAAAAMITFRSENRSTPLRIALLLLQAAVVAAFAWRWIASGYELWFIMAVAAFGGCYWFALGTMLDGEQAQMSQRVMRRLPQGMFGRMFFTWLNPGPATGYMFAVANLTVILLLCLPPTIRQSLRGTNTPGSDPNALMVFLALGWCYVVAYLGLGRLVVAFLRRFSEVSMFASVLLHLLLVLAGSGIPTCIQRMSLDMQNELYTYWQISNPVSTLAYVINFSPTPEQSVLLIAVPAAAICVLLLNLPPLARDLTRVRAKLPERVASDEAQLHPPPPPLPKNPWETDSLSRPEAS